MNYTRLDALMRGRSHKRKKLCNHTYAERRDNCAIAIRLHATDVLTFYQNGKVVVDSGGRKTPTTKDRINTYLGGPQIYQEKGDWFWWVGGRRSKIPFTDGDEVIDGELHAQCKPPEPRIESEDDLI